MLFWMNRPLPPARIIPDWEFDAQVLDMTLLFVVPLPNRMPLLPLELHVFPLKVLD